MNTKLKEAAEIHIAKMYGVCNTTTTEHILRDIDFGAQWQSEQSNQAIQELVQALEVATTYIRNLGGNADEYEHITQKYKPKQ